MVFDPITTDAEALTNALVLSVTAPTDEYSEECITMAEAIAANLTDKQIERAKEAALDYLNALEEVIN